MIAWAAMTWLLAQLGGVTAQALPGPESSRDYSREEMASVLNSNPIYSLFFEDLAPLFGVQVPPGFTMPALVLGPDEVVTGAPTPKLPSSSQVIANAEGTTVSVLSRLGTLRIDVTTEGSYSLPDRFGELYLGCVDLIHELEALVVRVKVNFSFGPGSFFPRQRHRRYDLGAARRMRISLSRCGVTIPPGAAFPTTPWLVAGHLLTGSTPGETERK